MDSIAKSPPQLRANAGFSLLELMAVMVIASVLLGAGFSIFGKTAAASRRTAMDRIGATVEQARTAAIARRKMVLLAISTPQPGEPEARCKFGIFEADGLPEDSAPVTARQLGRWEFLPDGVVFAEGKAGGLRNLMDEPEIELIWNDGRNRAGVRALAFAPRGGLAWPKGSDPVALRIASGGYRDGEPVLNPDGGHSALRVGRVVARPWKLEG